MAESSEEWVYPYITWGGNPREVVEIRKGEPLAHIGKGASSPFQSTRNSRDPSQPLWNTFNPCCIRKR